MGTLYLVATPIGNMEDISLRAIKTLFSVDYILCEDTRRTGQLITNLACLPVRQKSRIKNQELYTKNININKKPRFISFYDEIEEKRVPEIIELVEQGLNIALVSDSGTPLIADPGFKLVRECLKKNIKVVSVPGPTSLITALISSGLPPNQFTFLGYLPPNQTKRKKLLSDIKNNINSQSIHPTVILFETPHRLKESLLDIMEVNGDIELVICRELTKIHEEIWRGRTSNAINHFTSPKGEFVLLFNIPQVLSI